jgi:hypothetical protein
MRTHLRERAEAEQRGDERGLAQVRRTLRVERGCGARGLVRARAARLRGDGEALLRPRARVMHALGRTSLHEHVREAEHDLRACGPSAPPFVRLRARAPRQRSSAGAVFGAGGMSSEVACRKSGIA